MTDHDFIELVYEQVKQIKTEGGAFDASHLLAALCARQAQTPDELAMKLAVWRWSRLGPEGVESPPLTGAERLIYSAYRDAVFLTERSDLAPNRDYDTNFLAELMTKAA